jgi:hypothetical protein
MMDDKKETARVTVDWQAGEVHAKDWKSLACWWQYNVGEAVRAYNENRSERSRNVVAYIVDLAERFNESAREARSSYRVGLDQAKELLREDTHDEKNVG